MAPARTPGILLARPLTGGRRAPPLPAVVPQRARSDRLCGLVGRLLARLARAARAPRRAGRAPRRGGPAAAPPVAGRSGDLGRGPRRPGCVGCSRVAALR